MKVVLRRARLVARMHGAHCFAIPIGGGKDICRRVCARRPASK